MLFVVYWHESLTLGIVLWGLLQTFTEGLFKVAGNLCRKDLRFYLRT